MAPLRSRGTTQRSRTKPLGRTDYPSVRLGNLLCCRALILVILAACKGCMWVLEQLASSTMEWHPLFQKMLKMIDVRKMFISMCVTTEALHASLPSYTLAPELKFLCIYFLWSPLIIFSSKEYLGIICGSCSIIPEPSKPIEDTARLITSENTKWNPVWNLEAWWYVTKMRKESVESMVDQI